MNHRHRPTRLVAAGLVAAGAALGAVGAPAHAEPAGPDVPTAVAVPAGHKVFLVGRAVGVQIYSCNGERWSFVAPRADLYGDNGNLVTTHFGGPTWQAKDGSSVRARRDGDYTPDPTAIPWLRLAATSTVAGSDGERLAGTTYIQRTATTGGLEPAAAECNATTAGTTQEVPYTADYHFWKATGH